MRGLARLDGLGLEDVEVLVEGAVVLGRVIDQHLD